MRNLFEHTCSNGNQHKRERNEQNAELDSRGVKGD